jgi:hypothetical protein
LREFGDLFPLLAHYVANKFLKKADAHLLSEPAADRFKLRGPIKDDESAEDDPPRKDNGDSQ